VGSREAISPGAVARVVGGIWRRVYGGQVRSWEKVNCWSEIVIETEDAAGTTAWDAAKRVCRANGRELVPPRSNQAMGLRRIVDHGSDHAVIGARVTIGRQAVTRRRIDWAKVDERGERMRSDDSGRSVPTSSDLERDRVGARAVSLQTFACNCRAIETMVESGIKELRKRARSSRQARQQLRREIREAKRKMRNDWFVVLPPSSSMVLVCVPPYQLC